MTVTRPSIRVETLHLGTVQLPDQHPRSAEGTCTIDGFLIHHPDGPILVDTGVADDHELINQIYQPASVPIVEALNTAGVDERSLVAIVNTHLHFDHCGQNRFLPKTPVYVQAAELAAASQPKFTISEWAHIEDHRLRVVDGDHELADGVRLIATPGHTPGHQSICIDSAPDDRSIIVGQCCYTCAEFESATLLPGDMHDPSMFDVGMKSLGRLRALEPRRAFFSHDRTQLTSRGSSGAGSSE